MTNLQDSAVRLRALDIKQSFIVQAPAGSGKTALLTQRILALLGQANEPEECLAITFTRKAAAEMRARILQALQDAAQQRMVRAEYDQKTRQLAIAVLQRDQARHWQLLANPQRLKIQTIDSLNVSLTKRMPVLSGFGAQPEIVTNAKELYTLAAHAILTERIVDAHYLPALNIILQHLDHDRELVNKLFVSLLPLREQWLPYIMQTQDDANGKILLEQGLKTMARDLLQQLTAAIPVTLQELPKVAAQAAEYMPVDGDDAMIRHCRNLATWPAAKLSSLPWWQGIAELFLTKDGAVRKTVTQRQGFPAPTSSKDKTAKKMLKQHKSNMLAYLADILAYPVFYENLQALTHLPPLHYTAKQWHFMAALIKILPLLVAQLTVVFRDKGQIDLAEVSIAARTALGAADTPSDLALALDYKILHILVDEFQDTSIAQFRLLEHLTAGWFPGDGKTLFLVGDPMQSIYRFRQAEVGLFVNVQQYGLGNIKLESLALTANFRSSGTIVNWINQVFKTVFPATTNFLLGEVGYVPAMPTKLTVPGNVQFVCLSSDDDSAEAKRIVHVIEQQRQQYPGGSIAVLVRSRSHLPRLLAEFKLAGIAYQGIEIEQLAHKPVIQDLLALTKALLHLSDRIAWLAILRAPWCGLQLADLEALVSTNAAGCVWESLRCYEQLDLSADGKTRLQIVVPVLEHAIATRGKQPIMTLVFNTWLALAGNICGYDHQSLADTQVFLEVLRLYHNDPRLLQVGFFEQQLARLFSKPTVLASDAVQVMTIHKAKGLEFDTVILPGLGRKPVGTTARLFRWEERTSLSGKKHLIFAPIKAVGELDSPIYNFLKYTDQKRNHYELARLLYVATTRAKHSLFGFASTTQAEPAATSMLALIHAHVTYEEPTTESAIDHIVPQSNVMLRRLPLAIMQHYQTNRAANHQEFALSSDPAAKARLSTKSSDTDFGRQIGLVVHKVFWQISMLGLTTWQQFVPATLELQWQLMLQAAGVPSSSLSACLAIIKMAIANTIADPTGCWLLQQHQEAYSEWALTVVINGELQNLVIDRSFVDTDGTRWIIDYKTSTSDSNDIAKAIIKYRPQLKRYQQVLQVLFPNSKIKTALYFPLQTRLELVP